MRYKLNKNSRYSHKFHSFRRRLKRGNSSGVNRRPCVPSSKARRNSRIAKYRDGNEHQVDAAVVNRNFMTDELLNLRPRLKKVTGPIRSRHVAFWQGSRSMGADAIDGCYIWHNPVGLAEFPHSQLTRSSFN